MALGMLGYILSWFVDFILVAVVVAVLDEVFRLNIEKEQALGAFFLFFVPTLLEVLSYLMFNSPFLQLL